MFRFSFGLCRAQNKKADAPVRLVFTLFIFFSRRPRPLPILSTLFVLNLNLQFSFLALGVAIPLNLVAETVEKFALSQKANFKDPYF